VSEVEIEKLSIEKSTGERSAVIRDRVEVARERQRARYQETTIVCNGELTTKQAKQYIHMTDAGKTLLLTASTKLGLTARSYFKIIKVSQTIADLEGADVVDERHIAESLQFRPIVGN
jgi:magnesium chelatase family protein